MVPEDREYFSTAEENEERKGSIIVLAGKNPNARKQYGQGFYISAAWRYYGDLCESYSPIYYIALYTMVY